MKRYLPVVFLLLQAFALALAQNQHPIGQDQGSNRDPFQSDASSVPGGGTPHREPGADLVDAAWSELRKVHNPAHHRIRKKNSIFSTALHYALKALPTLRISAPAPVDSPRQIASGPLLQAVKLLEESSQKNNSDALFLLGNLNFYGNYTHPRNFKTAFDYYQKLALLNGNASALHMLGLMYSTGVGGAVERDQARALLYYTFAANSGNIRAEMTVANRHHMAIGTPKNCNTAVKYYKRVADKAIAWYRSGPPGGKAWIQEAYRIADEFGGAYGEGASVSSSGINAIKAHPNSDAYASIEDVIEYLDLMSQKGDFKASFNLGRIYYEGQRGLERDLELARKYFFTVTQKYWKKNRIVENPKPGLDKTASKAAGFIGRMYLRGEGMDQNFDRARFWFERGISHGDAQSQWGMGVMLLNGFGIQRNTARATELFRVASDQDFAPAQVQLGAMYLDQGHADDIAAANHYFELAARHGSIEAYYYLAEMNFFGVGREQICTTAVSYYKSVAERAEPLVSSWNEANLAYKDGDYELAILEYLGTAEQGYEKAQNNVAYLLDPANSKLPVPNWLIGRPPKASLLDDPSLALIMWTRSSRQGNIDSLVKMGDYYLHGIGVDYDVDKAVQCYTGASEYHQSAQALYNLGWMHENGVGLTQDYHLAKRYYDLALETNEEAYLPATLSLLKLRARSAWNTFTYGRINSIQDEPAPKKDWSVSEWLANFLSEDMYDGQYYEDIYDDGMVDGGATGEGLEDFDDDGLFESALILFLAGALVLLVMYRNQRQQQAERRRREEEERRRNQQATARVPGAGDAPAAGAQPGHPVQGGHARAAFLPQPGGPDFGQWAAGGVGH